VEGRQFAGGGGHDVVLVAQLILAMFHAFTTQSHRALDENDVAGEYRHLVQVVQRRMVGRNIGVLVAIGPFGPRRGQGKDQCRKQTQCARQARHGRPRGGNEPTTSERSWTCRAMLSKSMPRASTTERPLCIRTGASVQKRSSSGAA